MLSILTFMLIIDREPETYQESLECPEVCEHWKDAGAAERDVLQHRGVMVVTRRPEGIKLLKSRYVYKRRYNKDGTIKK